MALSELERRRRAVARGALYTSLAVSLGLLGYFVHQLQQPFEYGTSQDWYREDFEALEEVRLLREYARIDTTPETGDELAGARFLAAQLEAAGLETFIEPLSPGKANLWAILEGESPEALVLHNHIDVDPIHKPDEWLYEPFGAQVEVPWLYGRGVFDMKSVAIAQLMALVDLAQREERPKRSVIFLATSSEETGSDLGTRWILARHPELTERFWAVITEGGWLEMRNVEDLKYWGVEFAQKRYVDYLVCADDEETLLEARQDLIEVGHSTEDLKVVPEVREFLEVYWPTRDDVVIRRALRDPDALIRDVAAFLEMPGYVQALFRDEIAPFPPRRADGGGWEMLVKLHLLPGSDLAEVERRWLRPVTRGLEVVPLTPDPPHRGSPTDHRVMQAALEVLGESYPQAVVGPLFQPWTASDARFFRDAGIPAYGFSPFLIFTSDTIHVGGPNERISLPGYVEGVRLYRELVRRLVDTP